MDADDGVLDVRDVVEEILDERAVFVRRGVADGVGDIDRGRAGFDDGLRHLSQELRLGARGVLGRELDVLAVAERALDAFHGAFENLALRHLEFELAMDGARGEEHVNARAVARGFHGFGGAVDVLIDAAGQPGDARALDLAGDGFHGLEIAVAGDREARLDDVHAQPGQLPRDLEFLADVHGCARALLAVAQRRVEYQYLLAHGLFLSILAVDRGQTTKNPLSRGDSGFRVSCVQTSTRRLPREQQRQQSQQQTKVTTHCEHTCSRSQATSQGRRSRPRACGHIRIVGSKGRTALSPFQKELGVSDTALEHGS
jgi:hypothetical protein